MTNRGDGRMYGCSGHQELSKKIKAGAEMKVGEQRPSRWGAGRAMNKRLPPQRHECVICLVVPPTWSSGLTMTGSSMTHVYKETRWLYSRWQFLTNHPLSWLIATLWVTRVLSGSPVYSGTVCWQWLGSGRVPKPMTTQVCVADEGLPDDVCHELDCTPLNKSCVQVLTLGTS